MIKSDRDATLVCRAYEWAARWHRGQTDGFDGEPYLHHVLEVARNARPYGGDAEIVAALHDTVEHAGLSLDEIGHTFGPTIKEGVDAMSKRPGDRFFKDYMPRVLGDPIAVIVKRADAAANLTKTLRFTTGAERDKRTKKYRKAIRLCSEAMAARGLPLVLPSAELSLIAEGSV